MSKVSATEIRSGNLIVLEKKVWRVLKSYHVHVGGRGGAFMQIEIKDIESGTKKNERIRSDDKIERAFVDSRKMQYLYKDNDDFIFMNQESYEQINLSNEFIENQANFLIPNVEVQINFYNENPISIELPASVILTIIETEPGLKNATSTGSFKPAKMETGITVMVPQFISEGEKIKINTDTGEYIERSN